jgi:hypothetical protein
MFLSENNFLPKVEFGFACLVSIVVVYAHVIQFNHITTCCSCMNAGLVVKN